MQRLFDFAELLGVTVEYAPLQTRDGEYRHDLRRIRLREGMEPRVERFKLAHELAHAVHADVPSMLAAENLRQERRADEWAAAHLINLDQYREIELLRGGHVPTMAHDLGVTTQCVNVYRSMLARIGDTVYLDPRMGAGQYRAKATA